MAKKNDKSKTEVHVDDDDRLTTANTWWYNLTDDEQAPYRNTFKTPYAPNNDELLAAYDEAHMVVAEGEPKPVKIGDAKTWWASLYAEERKAYRDKYVDIPTDEELILMYQEAHKYGQILEPTEYTGEEPPTVQPPTPYASATNPELMANDAIPGENAALYEKSPIPEGYQPPEPPPPEA